VPGKIAELFAKWIAVIYLLILPVIHCQADGPGPPPPPGAHGQSGNQGPAGAPIDGGLGILIAMGGAYGARKLCRAKKNQE
jgi:hypothetical protein